MRFKVVISKDAEDDIREVYLWYENQKPELGNTFKQYLSKTILSIKRNPFQFRVRYNDVRISVLEKFPYGIHFNIANNKILIVAVFHNRRNPDSWFDR